MIINAAELKKRYKQRIAGVRDKKVYIGPEVVVLNTSNACNLNCQYCWFHSPGNPAHLKKARFFPWEKFLGVVSDAVDLNVDHICITGSGEPTMHPKFRDMMRYLEQQPLNVKVLTNATFPLAYCSDVIKGDGVLIDLSAVDRQQYRDIQGKDFFGRVVNNIKRLVSLRDAVKPDFQIDIVYIVNAVNIGQKQKMKELASRLGINSVHFKKMDVHGYNQQIALPGGTKSDTGGEFKRTPSVCLRGWFYVIIKPDDEGASICCRIPRMPLGNIDNWPLKQLWHSPKMMNMRLLGKYGYIQKMYQACQTCAFYDKNVQWAQALAGVKKE